MGTEQDNVALLTGRDPATVKRRRYIIGGVVILVVIIIVVIILIVTLTSSSDDSSPSEPDWAAEFLKGPSATEARANSKLFTAKEHVAGTPQNNEYAADIERQFKEMGMDAYILRYENIYLSQYGGSSLYQVNTSNPEQILVEFNLTEDYIPEDPTSNTTLRKQAWLGYSASGNVTGYVVYVNYGDAKDFDVLMNKLDFNLENKSVIALVRYGALFRGIKALNAADHGFKAVMVFSDPEDYGYTRGDVIPDGPWLPESGFQRGSAAYLNLCFGNPSPQRAVDRCGFDNESYILPSIPIIPLSYGNAKRLMEQMGGSSINDSDFTIDWQGGMDLEYRLGTVDESDGVMVSLSVSTTYGPPSEIENVIGYIAAEGPYQNESIMYGAHRDAWVFGAVDPISGTTSIIEVARAFSSIYKLGWRPKRNIYFLSWDAEEFDLIGSTEFAETEEKLVKEELVAYINQDGAVSGPHFSVSSDPLMEILIKDCMKRVYSPYSNSSVNKSVYSEWAKDRNNLNTGMLGSGSDFAVFVHEYGIASMDSGFRESGYGAYHSIYDSFFTMSEYIDPQYEYLRASAQIVGLIGFEMVNNDIIPFSTYNLYERLYGFIDIINKTGIEYNCSISNILTQKLINSIMYFGEVAQYFDEEVDILRELDDSDKNDQYQELVIKYNDAMRTLGTKFLYQSGLPKRKLFKNLIVTSDIDNAYSEQVLPYIGYAIKFQCENQTLLQEAYNITSQAITDAAQYLISYIQ